MKIGVLGGLGYIGSSLVSRLAENHDNEIIIGDNKSYKVNEEWFDWVHSKSNIEFMLMDITDKKKLKQFIDKCDKIVNLSALVGEDICQKDDKKTHAINYMAVRLMSDICKEQDKPLIFLSTCSFALR